MSKPTPKVNAIIPKARVLSKLAKLGYADEKSLQQINENIVFLSDFTNAERIIVVEIKLAVKNNMFFSYMLGTYSPVVETKKEETK